jgi:hypothetical protein
MKFGHYITKNKMNEGVDIIEEGAVAWDELTQFYKEASKEEITKMEMFVKKSDWEGFRKLVYSVIGIKIK